MQIHWRNPNHLSIERQLEFEQRIAKLADGHRDLIDIWIDVEKSDGRRGERAKIRCQARNVEIVAGGEGDDVEGAVRDALMDFEREVRERLSDRRRHRAPEPPPAP